MRGIAKKIQDYGWRREEWGNCLHLYRYLQYFYTFHNIIFFLVCLTVLFPIEQTVSGSKMYTNSNYFPDMSGFADTAGYSFSLDAAGDGAAGTPTNQGTNVDATAPVPYK